MTPSDNEYGDMLLGERPKDDDEKAIDKYLNLAVAIFHTTFFRT